MRSRVCSSVVAVLLIFSIGGHWALLQSVAWVSMVVNFSKSASLEVAVSKTFDGKHLCNICKLVKKGKETEQDHELVKVKAKLDYWMPVGDGALLLPAQVVDLSFASDFSFHSWTDGPPSPPPRLA